MEKDKQIFEAVRKQFDRPFADEEILSSAKEELKERKINPERKNRPGSNKRIFARKKIVALIAVAASVVLLAAILIPVFAFKNGGDGGDDVGPPGTGPIVANSELGQQVTAAKEVYENIYDRGIRKGGLFALSEPAAVRTNVKTSVSEANRAVVQPTGTETDNFNAVTDTSAKLTEFINIIRGDRKLTIPNQNALHSYVLDVFAYTQIASSILKVEDEFSLTKIYDVVIKRDADFYANMSLNGWMPKIPEEMSFAGYDKDAGKVNIIFTAPDPKIRVSGRCIETVNSEIYYRADDDFGYAQITTRYDPSGVHYETGFNYCDMKTKSMLELNFNVSGQLANATAFVQGSGSLALTTDERKAIETMFVDVQEAFAARTAALEQKNLTLAKESELIDESWETDGENGESRLIKKRTVEPLNVAFDYDLLDKLVGVNIN